MLSNRFVLYSWNISSDEIFENQQFLSNKNFCDLATFQGYAVGCLNYNTEYNNASHIDCIVAANCVHSYICSYIQY